MKRPWQLPELSKKERKRLKKLAKLRDPFEIWIDHHNHKLEVLRTIGSLINAILGFCVFLKVFGVL
ncbi:MAG: hypothetical protein EBR82_51085, partial [Caulobacteraceae bacterium]|nr:hypothetical protein [Caulobacteraceae bacterium]